jgi:hypothetical protein
MIVLEPGDLAKVRALSGDKLTKVSGDVLIT